MKRALRAWFLALAALIGLGAAPARAQQTLEYYVQRNLRDFQGSTTVLAKHDRELAKIGRDFVEAYNLQRAEFFFKEPGCVRMQGRRGVATVRFITNGDRKLIEVPTLRIREVKNIAQDPGEGETALDFGVLTPSVLAKIEGRFLRMENRHGKNCAVFEVWFRAEPKAKHTLWLDPRTRTVVEHIEHHRSRRKSGFKKRWVFSEVRSVNGVHLPTRVDVYNPENKLAGSSRYDNLRVNVGLNDQLFRF